MVSNKKMQKIRNWHYRFFSKVQELVLSNKVVTVSYKIRTYFNIGVSQISWFTGKLPEIMGALWLLDWMGINISSDWALVTGVFIFLFITILGYVLKKSGLFIKEREIEFLIDPMWSKITYQLGYVYDATKKNEEENL